MSGRGTVLGAGVGRSVVVAAVEYGRRSACVGTASGAPESEEDVEVAE